MSTLSIANYFPFSRVKIKRQSVAKDASLAWIEIKPDLRFKPICSLCKREAGHIHSQTQRVIRDLNLASAKIFINCWYRKVFCSNCCGIYVENQVFVLPYLRVTKRLACYIHKLCKKMTITDVANHLDLDWKTVKNIDKSFLEEEFSETDYTNLRIIAIDEISVRKGHKYYTVVIDYETGRVVWMGEGRTKETLDAFFKPMTEEQRNKIEAVSMDMWSAYINRVKYWCPNAKIVFDLFHVVKDFNKVIDKTRNREYHKANTKEKGVIKGSKFLLLKNKENLKPEERPHLKELLKLNERLSILYILKDALKKIWGYRYPAWAKKALDEWCSLAYESGIQSAIAFANRLKTHEYGILNHCLYPISTGKLEGTNNKIKVIHRNAYGFHDPKYFIYKVKQAFP